MGTTQERRADTVLDMIDELDDEDLCTVVARARARLLDRPVPPSEPPALTVEVVERDEEHMLACYRALAPWTREQIRHDIAARARANIAPVAGLCRASA